MDTATANRLMDFVYRRRDTPMTIKEAMKGAVLAIEAHRKELDNYGALSSPTGPNWKSDKGLLEARDNLVRALGDLNSVMAKLEYIQDRATQARHTELTSRFNQTFGHWEYGVIDEE